VKAWAEPCVFTRQRFARTVLMRPPLAARLTSGELRRGSSEVAEMLLSPVLDAGIARGRAERGKTFDMEGQLKCVCVFMDETAPAGVGWEPEVSR
jgi:hypothetical protein